MIFITFSEYLLLFTLPFSLFYFMFISINNLKAEIGEVGKPWTLLLNSLLFLPRYDPHLLDCFVQLL